jgi:putative transposase
MSRKYKFHDQDKLYFISFTVIHWIDLFTRNEYKDEMINSWKYCIDKKGLEVYGWCIMTSHVHIIIGTGSTPMQDIIRDMKSFTSRRLKEVISLNPQESRKEWLCWMMEREGKKNLNNGGWQLWQQDNQPLVLENEGMFTRALNYIHNNPVSAGFVQRPEDWTYSSAGDFQGRKGMIPLCTVR